MEIKRERVMTDEETRKKVREFADEKGLKIPRAFGILVEKGIEALGH